VPQFAAEYIFGFGIVYYFIGIFIFKKINSQFQSFPVSDTVEMPWVRHCPET
jgi:hypothetical protein